MEAFVKAGSGKLGKVFARLGDHFNRDGVIGLLFHDLMVKGEPVLVFHDAGFEPKLNRHAGLVFGDPFGMGLENRK